jgi:DNA replicative helicase MCM subunit Mcm2 (Cdc46/Mcm family)
MGDFEEQTVNILLLGDSEVGKSTFLSYDHPISPPTSRSAPMTYKILAVDA